METKAGRLDVLREAGGENFGTLWSEAVDTEHGFKIASLESLRRMKLAASRPKDAEGLSLIEAALAASDDS